MPENKTRQEFEADLVAKAWKDDAFKQELLSNPKAIIAKESGVQVPDNIEVRVLEENPNILYLVLPVKPADLEGEGELSEEALEAVAGGSGGFLVYSGKSGKGRYVAGGC
ncbi:NHLP leader peptide family RiPP precursor [Brasilonema sp. UFV-L1]|uniref:NHLP leader peptide family RiPP precursor n=1 Tax=Brasilonema sp. UFV-L1 TaxID=2234130 RepID=UPI00145EAEF6|nr:NHLP leader peptide family RiPP precursor [Brasilonema sp. UFV-L1]NMG05529.1 NHLP leader peptide family natural product precursor [Brasilonema sp. UFV-L1]